MLRKLPFFVMAAFLAPLNLNAFCFPLPRLIRAEYTQSQLVVIAKLVARKSFPSQNGQEDSVLYTLESVRTFRGKPTPVFKIREYNDSGRASFDWILGKSYLLFLNLSDEGTWWPYNCGNSAPLEEADSTLRTIDSIKSGHGGFLQGLVSDDGGYPHRNSDDSVEGIHVIVKSGGRSYQTTTDHDGVFHIHLPPGRYTVTPVQTGQVFKTDPFTYENPQNVVIENGGAAQVVFQRAPAKAN